MCGEVRRFSNISSYGGEGYRARDRRLVRGQFARDQQRRQIPVLRVERSFQPQLRPGEWNHIYTDLERIYLVTLAQDTKSPLAPKSDEVKPRRRKKEEKPKDTPPDVKSADKPLKTLSDLLKDPEFRKVVVALSKNPDAQPEDPPASPGGPKERTLKGGDKKSDKRWS
ncbi:MAG: hypothetical protein KIT22_00610 [Verrucomicrobiae bacterium]|nr:hypothetical protein [Verrucomicrobiae bacterium]